MGAEIYVNGDLEKALRKLKRDFMYGIYSDLTRHNFFQSRGQLRRKKIWRSYLRRLKQESRGQVAR